MKDERLIKMLLSPHVSEKSTNVTDRLGQYVFEVVKGATKPEIKKAVEALFSVKVKNVRVVNVRAKTKRFAQIEGKRQSWKKAYVSLQEGQKIDLAGGEK